LFVPLCESIALITESGGIGAKFFTQQNFDPFSRKARTN
jgi:hypothetical protein